MTTIAPVVALAVFVAGGLATLIGIVYAMVREARSEWTRTNEVVQEKIGKSERLAMQLTEQVNGMDQRLSLLNIESVPRLDERVRVLERERERRGP